jgi:hypothetical protein
MTTGGLLLLRVYVHTLGRFPFFSGMLKKGLVHVLIKRAKKRYVASSRYFDWSDLDP